MPESPYRLRHYTKAKVQKNYHVIIGEERNAARWLLQRPVPLHRQGGAKTRWRSIMITTGLPCGADVEIRRHAKTSKYLKAGKLSYHALPEDILRTPERVITREQVLRLPNGMFIEKGRIS